MVSADRQTIMETNRSLRNIKTELENLLEKGVIDEAVFDNIHSALPQESSLSGPLRTATGTSSAAARSSPAQNTAEQPPTQAFQNLAIGGDGAKPTSAPPPCYDDTPPPNVPAGAPPQQQNPYNSSAPPMAVADGGQPAQDGGGGDSKMGGMGKKIGKKLGNAAIFGAGATIGGNIVNSIF
ncbi:SH3 domain protein [Ophiocordyceps sinensis CO18]|uniref:SH3 domain protein n=1 Tax=Ophiocordyceps sinensis (strain Co18 / CGMCC 3.14243) TaxID=911162 RepID=T5ADK7_OPHSC|nr:SH3 domain protein [Ophiocordyceps sinensis CO18]